MAQHTCKGLGWVIRDSNGIIKMTASRHISNASMIIAKCVTSRDYMPTSKNNGFVNPKTESKSKILIDCYNKKSNIPSTIMLLMEDIWKLTHDLNIHNCHHIYRKTNRIAYCLAKKKFAV